MDGDIMKKSILLILAILLCVFCCSACSKNDSNEPTDAPHSLSPTLNASVEYEWAPIDCDIALVNNDSNIYVSEKDFETFAVVGSGDSAYIILKVSDSATQQLNSLNSATMLSLTINGEKVDGVSISSVTFNGEIEFAHDMKYEQLCELANTIRGLFN